MTATAIEVQEKPILFSGAMVRKIIEDLKTNTRRVMNPQPSAYVPSPNVHPAKHDSAYFDSYCNAEKTMANPRGMSEFWCWWTPDNRQGPDWIRCPYGRPGDRLWVRETFWCANESCDHEYCGGCDLGSLLPLGKDYAEVQYVATPECCDLPILSGTETINPEHSGHTHGHGDWWLGPPSDWDGHSDYHGTGMWEFLPTTFTTKHPSIHMPRWASRLTLEIVSVKVERVQEISEEDAKAEGVEPYSMTQQDIDDLQISDVSPNEKELARLMGPGSFSHKFTFQMLWDELNKKRGFGWDKNPWVWCIEFKKVEGPTA